MSSVVLGMRRLLSPTVPILKPPAPNGAAWSGITVSSVQSTSSTGSPAT